MIRSDRYVVTLRVLVKGMDMRDYFITDLVWHKLKISKMIILKLKELGFHARVRFSAVQLKLPRPNLILDPRVNWPRGWRFDCRYHDDGVTVTLTRTDCSKDDIANADDDHCSMRAYDPQLEEVPRFDTTTYTYMGQLDEYAPLDTIVGIIDPSVNVIKDHAFWECTKMRKCIIHNQVHTIEMGAFHSCKSLEALFLPSSLKRIGLWAFNNCSNIRILPLPSDMSISNVDGVIFGGDNIFFDITGLESYYTQFVRNNRDQVNRSIIGFYRFCVPPLHKSCLNVNVSVQSIQGCILDHGTDAASIIDHDGMTPLHILAMNPHADSGTIVACLETDKRSAFVGDSRGNTPLDYLLKEDNFEGFTAVVMSLCVHREVHLRTSYTGSTNDDVDRKRKRINYK